MIDMLQQVVTAINDVLWGYILIFALVGIGIFFTVYLGFPQFVRFSAAVRQVFGKLYKDHPTDRDGKSISSLQALAVAISAQVGTGNIAGVATAIMAGGPGAIFWMWLSALGGMGTIFAEAILAQRYREEVKGRFVGGPAFYISKGLKNVLGEGTSRFLAGFFAVAIIIALGFIGNMVQSNSIASAMQHAFSVEPFFVGIGVAVVAGLVFIGGINRIAHVAQIVVPGMAALYIVCTLIILCMYHAEIIPTLRSIVIGAFDPQAVGGGLLGVGVKEAVRYGVARGLFSNEAGMGSTPHAHATALVTHPVLQGFTAFIGVFVDTMIICTSTALIILLTGANHAGVTGALVTQVAFENAFGGVGPGLIAICLTFFAFTTIIGWYYFGESNIRYLFKSQTALQVYRVVVLLFIAVGALGKVDLVWDLSDLFNGIMVIPNIIALIFLRTKVKQILHDYDLRRQDGVPYYNYPVFKDSDEA